jgi:hypothetical protein
MTRRNIARGGCALAIALAALGCASRSAIAPRHGFAAIHDFAMRARVERVAVGQTTDEARAILGREPVHKPGHPDDPFPSPVRAFTLEPKRGDALRIELYVVAARAAEGCPDVQIEDVPVVFRGGAVAARGWEAVEAGWRAWGGTLAALRSARDTHRCDAPAALSAAR